MTDPLTTMGHKDFLIENLRGMCAFRDPDGQPCERVRAVSEFCTSCLAAVRLEKAEAEIARLTQERDKAQALAERLKQEAQIHARQEARTQRGTVHECYQAVGAQLGDWHGAEPIQQFRAKAEADRLLCQQALHQLAENNATGRRQLAKLREGIAPVVEAMQTKVETPDYLDSSAVWAWRIAEWAETLARLLGHKDEKATKDLARVDATGAGGDSPTASKA